MLSSEYYRYPHLSRSLDPIDVRHLFNTPNREPYWEGWSAFGRRLTASAAAESSRMKVSKYPSFNSTTTSNLPPTLYRRSTVSYLHDKTDSEYLCTIPFLIFTVLKIHSRELIACGRSISTMLIRLAAWDWELTIRLRSSTVSVFLTKSLFFA